MTNEIALNNFKANEYPDMSNAIPRYHVYINSSTIKHCNVLYNQ